MDRSVVMSRSRKGPRLGLALTGAILVILAVLLPSRAEAQFGFRGGPLGVARFAVIYNANRAKIHNPNLIYPGQTFVLPQKAE